MATPTSSRGVARPLKRKHRSKSESDNDEIRSLSPLAKKSKTSDIEKRTHSKNPELKHGQKEKKRNYLDNTMEGIIFEQADDTDDSPTEFEEQRSYRKGQLLAVSSTTVISSQVRMELIGISG